MKRLVIEKNQRFNRWTVVREVASRRSLSGKPRRRFLCRCDCGNEVVVLLESLRAGQTQSCGCYKKEQFDATVSLEGQRFNRLLVLKEAPKPPRAKLQGRGRYWECLCDCGNRTVVLATSLRAGKSQSCGCLRIDRLTTVNYKHGHAGSLSLIHI